MRFSLLRNIVKGLSLSLFLTLLANSAEGKEAIRLPQNPALSPDAKQIAFDWNGDIWTVSSEGGLATALTRHPAKDSQPKFSPDGKEIAFVSDRHGSPQVYVMPATGGTPKQVTFHTAGYSLYEWLPDGKGWLVGTQRDYGWSRKSLDRLFIVHRVEEGKSRKAEELLFDDYALNASLSPDGRKVLFTREGADWWRKGYQGSQAAQVWMYDRDKKTFSALRKDPMGSTWPLWNPKGTGIFCVEGKSGCFNLWEHNFTGIDSVPSRAITQSTEDSVVFPCISRDGSTLVYRQLFDLYRIRVGEKQTPVRLEIYRDEDRVQETVERKILDRAQAVSFTNEGNDIVFQAGGDLWVMDTELKEPKALTQTPEEERQPIFSPDGQSIFFVRDTQGQTDIWRAKRSDPQKPWWLNNNFTLEKITTDGEIKNRLSFSPDGSQLAYIRGRGDLWVAPVADLDAKNHKRIIESWNAPAYDWSPDGKWLVYAISDNDFNRDIWIRPLDNSKPPFNLSRHPYNEEDPVWSPDGKLIAFLGDRDRKENSDIHYVWLRAEDDEKSARDRSLEKALQKQTKPTLPMKKDGPEPGKVDPKEPMPPLGTKKTPVEVKIDFDGIHERIRRVTIANTNEGNLFWSPDSKRLAFSANIDGQPGTYTIEIPDGLKPTQLSAQVGTHAKWLKNGQIVWLSAGLPGSIPGGGSPGGIAPRTTTPTATPPMGPRASSTPTTAPAATGSYRFSALQEIDIAKKHQAAFDVCWRTMRDFWYDEKLGNRNWNAIHAKYRPVAETVDGDTLTTVVQLMLGELNGSHLGYFHGITSLPTRRPGMPPEEPSGDRKWFPVTVHLGIRFDHSFAGPGLKVRDVLPEGPADQSKSRIHPGEIVLAIDGVIVDPTIDLTTVLNGPAARDIRLKVKDLASKEREVVLRPTSYTVARQLLYRAWMRDNRTRVENASKGTLGYLHISAMDMPSFQKFEEELYSAGAGKEGLIIDVRENGGGMTADHLLTALTQPRHAIAIPRGSSVPGYPQDRTVYATWNKPIIVLCNQNSFSNAEIFSHAVKTLKRGQLVGVPTAGGVISTGGTAIMDVGFLRLPFRGWYLVDDGEDMELHGAVPHHIVWPHPGDMPQGKDDQLQKAVEVLLADVNAWKKRPLPSIKKATDRK